MAHGRTRLAGALGNTRRELALLPELEGWEDFSVQVCVHAAELLARVRAGAIDAILVSDELPGFGAAQALDLARTRAGARLVLLATDPAAKEWSALSLTTVLPLEVTPGDIRAALATATWADAREAPAARIASMATSPTPTEGDPEAAPDPPFAVMAVASGAGSPGRSTVALNLAAALGAVAPTVLVDLDLAGPSVAALLDANPRRNLFQIAYGQPVTPEEWDRELGRALQPLDRRSPHGRVLCGLATPAMRAGVTVDFFMRTVDELRARFRYVLFDLGTDLLGSDGALHRAALRAASQILVVTTPDVVDLLRIRTQLGALDTQLSIERERVALVVNRHDRRHHQSRRAIEWALGCPLAACLPYDRYAIERAKAAHRPVVLDRRSRAGCAMLDLAGRVHGGSIALPPEAPRRWRLMRTGFLWRPSWRVFGAGTVQSREAGDGD